MCLTIYLSCKKLSDTLQYVNYATNSLNHIKSELRCGLYLFTMKNFNCSTYFRVYLHQTSISEVPANDFKRTASYVKDSGAVYSLPIESKMFSDYTGIVEAMERAKVGAISQIDKLIGKGEGGTEELYQYRNDHYNDLNFNLIDANIRKVESELKQKKIN